MALVSEILKSAKTQPSLTIMINHIPERCMYCNGVFSDDYIYWWGDNAQVISLHKDCAIRLAAGLLQDAKKLMK